MLANRPRRGVQAFPPISAAHAKSATILLRSFHFMHVNLRT
jgi:hypothetical protein